MRVEGRAALLRLSAFALYALPAAAFYRSLLPFTIDVPRADDYGSLVLFSIQFTEARGFLSKILVVFTEQFNDYKLIFENFIAALSLVFVGRLNFTFFQILGDLFVVPVVLAVYLAWKDGFEDAFAGRGAEDRGILLLLGFLPVPYLIFQLNYWETLNWAMAGLTNLPVVAFALLSIRFLPKPTRPALLFACGFFVLAVFANGNGLLLAPIGVALLLAQSRRKCAIAWALLSLVLSGLYFYRYHSYRLTGPLLDLPFQIRLRYALSFLGAAAADFSARPRSNLLLGALMAAIAAGSFLSKRARREQPALLYGALFVVLTAVGVSALRSKFGLGESLAPRYRIYSDVLMALSFLLVVKRLGASPRAYCAVALAAFAFAASANAIMRNHYAPWLRARQTVLRYEVAAREKSGVSFLDIPFSGQSGAEAMLARAGALRIYALPKIEETADIRPRLPSGLARLIARSRSYEEAWQRLFLFYLRRSDLVAAFPLDSRELYGNLLARILARKGRGQGESFGLYPYRARYETMAQALNLARPVAPPAFLSAAKSGAVADCSIDAVDGRPFASLGKPVAVKGRVRVEGWAAPSARRGIGPDAIWIALTAADGKRRFYKARSRKRPDVLGAFKKPRMKAPGFSANLDVKALSGKEELTIYAVHDTKDYRCQHHALLAVAR